MSREGPALLEFARQLPRNLHGLTIESLADLSVDEARKRIRNKAVRDRRATHPPSAERADATRATRRERYAEQRDVLVTIKREELLRDIRFAMVKVLDDRLADIVQLARGEKKITGESLVKDVLTVNDALGF